MGEEISISSNTKKVLLEFFRNPIFLAILGLKILASLFFISDIPRELFIPFLNHFAENPLGNPYDHFFSLGITNAFPYPAAMLWITGLPFIIFSWFNSGLLSSLDLFLLRIPLLLADIAILTILVLLKPNKQKLIMILYWLSPVVFYINYIHGQLDIIPIALLLISLYLLVHQKFIGSLITLGLSVAAKSHIILILPFYLFYIYRRKSSVLKTTKNILIFLFTYLVLIFLYFSNGFIKLVFGAKEQFRLLEMSINFAGGMQFYIVLAVYLYLVFKALSFRKITKELLIMFTGVTFTLLVTLVSPSQGWYLWSIPFLVYFFANEKRYRILYWSFNALYLTFFAIIPGSDIFSVFYVISQQIASLPTPYELIDSLGYNTHLLVNTIFTLLSANLLYIAYLMHKYGIKSNLIFQNQGGIPIVGISGDSGTGKTTLARLLSDLFGKESSTVICGDDIHKWERGDPNWEKFTHLNPLSNKLHYHYDHVKSLKKGESVHRPVYDHDTGKFTDPKKIHPKQCIIDEGLHTLFIMHKSLYSLKVFMDPDPDLKFYWKISRDMEKRGYSKKKAVGLFKKRKKDSQKFISPQRDAADVIISVKSDSDLNAGFGKNINLYVEFLVKTDIPLDNLLECIEKKTGLELKLNYMENTFLKITLKGDANAEDIRNVIRCLDLDETEYGIRMENVEGGIPGLKQAFVFYCLHRRIEQNYENIAL